MKLIPNSIPCMTVLLAASSFACNLKPDEADTTDGSTSTDTSQSTGTTEHLPTTDVPTTADTTTGDTTTEDSTTGAADLGPARLLYLSQVKGKVGWAELRLVEISSGVATPPTTLIAAPQDGELGFVTLDDDRRRMAVTGLGADGVHLWIVELATLAVEEVPLAPGLNDINEPIFSPDGTRLLFAVGVINGPWDLFGCTLAGGCTPEQMSPPMVSERFFWHPAFSPANEWLAYPVQLQEGGWELHLGETATPGVSTSLFAPANEWTFFDSLSFAADEQTLYFSADVEVEGQREYFAVDISTDPPGVPVKLNPPAVGDARGLMAPNASALLWWAGDGQGGDLVRLPLSGTNVGAPELLNVGMPGHVSDFRWSDDAGRVVFLADLDIPGVDALYVAAVGGGPPEPVRLSGPLAAGGGVESYTFTPDPNRMLYFAWPDATQGLDLFLARVDAPDELVKLNAPLPAGGSLGGFLSLSHDGTRLMYPGSGETADTSELFLVDLAGDEPTSPVKLNGPVPDVGFGMQWASDNQRVFFTAAGAPTLYTVELGPGAPSTPIGLSDLDEVVVWMLALPPSP